MRNKSLIHTKDIKTQEGTPLHLEYYLLMTACWAAAQNATA